MCIKDRVRMSGRFARPAIMGLQPQAYWKCRMRANMTPAMAIEVPTLSLIHI